MNVFLVLIVGIATTAVGITCLRSLRRMQASGVASPVLDWRTIFGPRKEYSRAEHPSTFRLLIVQAAVFATISFAMALMITLVALAELLVWLIGS
jgi:hypothetical protein